MVNIDSCISGSSDIPDNQRHCQEEKITAGIQRQYIQRFVRTFRKIVFLNRSYHNDFKKKQKTAIDLYLFLWYITWITPYRLHKKAEK